MAFRDYQVFITGEFQIWGPWYYNKTIRSVAAVFGTLFNDIHVARRKSDGSLTNEKRVPIAYGPKQSFLERIRQRPDLEDTKVAMKLPRMSFSYSTPLYDPERQRSKRGYIQEGRDKIKNPAPYRIPFELSIYTKNEDEALQIIEQILPYFNPSVGVTIKPVVGKTFTDNLKFTFLSANKDDQYEGAADSTQRVLIYTLTFDAAINLYKNVDYFRGSGATGDGSIGGAGGISTGEYDSDITERPVIKRVIINHIDGEDEVFDDMTLTINPLSAEANEEFEIVCE